MNFGYKAFADNGSFLKIVEWYLYGYDWDILILFELSSLNGFINLLLSMSKFFMLSIKELNKIKNW